MEFLPEQKRLPDTGSADTTAVLIRDLSEGSTPHTMHKY